MKRTGIKVMDVKVDDQAQRCKPRIHRADTGMKKPIDCQKWDLYLIPRVSIGAFRAALDGLVSPAVGKRANQIRAFRTRATAKITGPRCLFTGSRWTPVPAGASVSSGSAHATEESAPRIARVGTPLGRGSVESYIYGVSLSPLPFSTYFRPLLSIIAVGRGGGDFLVPHSPLGLKLLKKHLKIPA